MLFSNMDIHIGDCSWLWEEKINEAYDSLLIFTPYFDYYLEELLDNCELPYESMTLVSQLDYIDDREENLNRLRVMLNLMSKGVNVLKLERLHAKALVVDEDWAIFGSQNFTNYSRSSVEISTEIESSEGFDWVFSDLKALLDDAEEVSNLDIYTASNHELFF